MENKEKQNIKLKFGLALKKILDRNKELSVKIKEEGKANDKLITSFGKLESSSGIPKATLVRIVSGKKNAAATTIAAVLEALEIKLSEFGIIYDSLTEKEITEYKFSIENKKSKNFIKKKKQA
jgi:hypothetical protein